MWSQNEVRYICRIPFGVNSAFTSLVHPWLVYKKQLIVKYVNLWSNTVGSCSASVLFMSSHLVEVTIRAKANVGEGKAFGPLTAQFF